MTQASLTIRPFNLDQDFDQVHKLNSIINGDRPEETVYNELRAYSGDIFVGLEKGRIIGFISLSPCLWNEVVMIDHLAVDEKHRRRGIGQALVRHVLEEADKRSARIICVQTALWNWEGIKFYRREGFLPKTILPDYFGEKNDLVWLDKSLRS